MRIAWHLRRAVRIGWKTWRALRRGENVTFNTSPGSSFMRGCTFEDCKVKVIGGPQWDLSAPEFLELLNPIPGDIKPKDFH